MPWPIEKDTLLSLGMAEELPVLWSSLNLCGECFHPTSSAPSTILVDAPITSSSATSENDTDVVCPDCRCARYCSEECQSDHAAAHSAVCTKLATIQFNEWDDLDLKGPPLTYLDGSKFGKEGQKRERTRENSTPRSVRISSEDIMLLTRQCLTQQVDPDELSYRNPPQTVDQAEDLLHRVAHTHKGAQFGMALVAAAKARTQEAPSQVRFFEQEALHWTRKAAYNGLADAQVRYAMQYWFDGTADHTVDFIQAMLWLRRALAQGKSSSSSECLSERAFLQATNQLRRMAQEYYNTLNRLEMKQRGIGYQREMKLVAECGIVPAINMVWLVHSRGDWYEAFFAQVEREQRDQGST